MISLRLRTSDWTSVLEYFDAIMGQQETLASLEQLTSSSPRGRSFWTKHCIVPLGSASSQLGAGSYTVTTGLSSRNPYKSSYSDGHRGKLAVDLALHGNMHLNLTRRIPLELLNMNVAILSIMRAHIRVAISSTGPPSLDRIELLQRADRAVDFCSQLPFGFAKDSLSLTL